MAVGLKTQVKDNALTEPADQIVQGEGDDATTAYSSRTAQNIQTSILSSLLGMAESITFLLKQRHRDRGKRDTEHEQDA
jgi:hypothetical protein